MIIIIIIINNWPSLSTFQATIEQHGDATRNYKFYNRVKCICKDEGGKVHVTE